MNKITQNDFFMSQDQVRIHELRTRQRLLRAEMDEVGQQLQDMVRELTRIPLNEEGSVFVCRFPSGGLYIGRQEMQIMGEPKLREFFPISVDLLNRAAEKLALETQ